MITTLVGWIAFLAGYLVVFVHQPDIALGVMVMFLGHYLYWLEPGRPKR